MLIRRLVNQAQPLLDGAQLHIPGSATVAAAPALADRKHAAKHATSRTTDSHNRYHGCSRSRALRQPCPLPLRSCAPPRSTWLSRASQPVIRPPPPCLPPVSSTSTRQQPQNLNLFLALDLPRPKASSTTVPMRTSKNWTVSPASGLPRWTVCAHLSRPARCTPACDSTRQPCNLPGRLSILPESRQHACNIKSSCAASAHHLRTPPAWFS